MMSCAEASMEVTATAGSSRPVKLFVGEIPDIYDEKDLRTLFQLYGDVLHLKLPRDPITGFHKGCCFVTYGDTTSAKRAQFHLRSRKCLQGMYHPMRIEEDGQHRPEDPERMLFIAMLPKQYDELQLRAILSPYGEVEDCKVLRDPSGRSEACAYAFMSTKLQCITAIQHLHYGRTMEGASSPPIVTFAGPECKREDRRLHGHQKLLPRQKERTEAYNLVIADIPPIFDHVDLMDLFSPFGKVINAQVFIGFDKWFGFVSYNHKESATLAICALNGYKIGRNCLEVSRTEQDLNTVINIMLNGFLLRSDASTRSWPV